MSDLADVEICRLQEECRALRVEIERLKAKHDDWYAKSLRLQYELLTAVDACAVPTPEQCEQMETGFGAIYTPRMALELGMKTAIGNVKRAFIKMEGGK
jgi:hypothetical protein